MNNKDWIKNSDNLYYHFKGLDIEELVDIDIRYNSINEKCHNTKIFDNVIDHICDILYNNEYYENPFYSDYCYIRKSNICDLIKENNIKIINEIPIYVYITELDNNTIISVDNRDFSEIHKANAIVIRINEKYLKNNKFNIYAGLKHEGLHALEMFVLKHFNLLDLQKNTDGSNITNEFNISDTLFRDIKYMLYLLSLSEQRAHINGTIGYLTKIYNNVDFKGATTLYDMVSLLIEKSSLHNKSTKLYNNIKKFTNYLNNNELYIIFILGYYLCKFTLIKDKDIIKFCNKSNIIKFINNRKYTDNDKNIAKNIIDYMDKNRREYQKKLCDSILNNIIYNG